jgi:hypothetical protein
MLYAHHAAVEVESVASSGASCNFCIIESFVGEVALGGAGEDVGFVKSIESAGFGFFKDEG